MFLFGSAEFFQFQPTGSGAFVLGRRIIPTLAFGASQGNKFAGHWLFLSYEARRDGFAERFVRPGPGWFSSIV